MTVAQMRTLFGVSTKRACAVVQLQRSTFYKKSTRKDDSALRLRIARAGGESAAIRIASYLVGAAYNLLRMGAAAASGQVIADFVRSVPSAGQFQL